MIIQGDIKLKIGDSLIFQGPTTGSVEEKIVSIEKDHKEVKIAQKGEKVAIKINSLVRENDQIYIIRKNKV
jgi:putative protease